MRKMRILIILFFVATTALFVVYNIKNLAVEDSQAPVISCDSDTIQVSIESTEEDLLSGMSAQDNRDGDVTDSMVVVSKSKFVEKGKCRVNYAAFDKNSNVATYTRYLEYTDYTSPHFSITEPLRFDTSKDVENLSQYIHAEDCLDGDISGLIKMRYVDDGYVYGQSGDVGINCQVTNTSGDTVQMTVNLEMLDAEEYNKTHPILTEYLVYTRVNESVDPSQYLIGVETGMSQYLFEEHEGQIGDEEQEPEYERDDIRIESNVDYNTPGIYTIRYTATSFDGYNKEIMGSTTLYVIVEE